MLIPEASNFMTLVDFFSFAAWLFYGGTFAALLWLRYKQPNINRPYKVLAHHGCLVAYSAVYYDTLESYGNLHNQMGGAVLFFTESQTISHVVLTFTRLFTSIIMSHTTWF